MNEDDIIGPLYKTTITKPKFIDLFNPIKPYGASVSKINQILSLFIVSIWVGLIVDLFVSRKIIFSYSFDWYFSLVGVFTFVTICGLVKYGVSTLKEEDNINFTKKNDHIINI